MRFVKTAESIFDIPSNFTRVEYLESTGTQYIDTGITGNNNIKIQTKIYPTVINKFIFGSRSSSAINAFGLFVHSNDGGSWYPFFYNGKAMIPGFAINNDYTIEFSKDGLVVNGTLLQGPYDNTFTNALTMKLFAMDTNGTLDNRMFVGKVYYAKLWDNGVLVRDMMPCIDPLGRPCLYDLVGKKAYYNQGTGEFTVGRQIIPVEYLESTGTQYIDTMIKSGVNMSVKAKFNLLDVSAKAVFGSYSGSASNGVGVFFGTAGGNLSGKVYCNNTNIAVIPDLVLSANIDYELEMSGTSLILNNSEYTAATTANNNYNMLLFARSNNGTVERQIAGKIYYFTIKDNNTLVCNLIPCKDENNVGFMFDTVSGTVYENKGTGTFAVGQNKYKMKLRLIKDNILPTGYTQLEYIEAENGGGSTVVQYAVGNYRLTNTTDWEITFSAENSNNSWVLGQPTWIGIHYRKDTTTGNLPRVGITNGSIAGTQCYVDYTDNEKITLALKGTDVYANGVKAGSITRASAGATQTKYGIFAYKDINQELPNLRIQSARIYRLKIWDNDVLVQDLVPAINSEGVAGFYERVNKTFIEKESNSTSDFTTGKPMLPVVRFPVDPDPAGYKIVNYLESTGTQYIDTGFKPNPATTKIDCAFCAFSGGSTQMFGARTVASSTNENNTNICFDPLGGKIYIRGDWIRSPNNLVTDIEPEQYIHLIAHNQTVSINGTEYSFTLEKNNTYLDYNFCLFACNTAGTIQFYSKIRQYNFKIYDNNTLVRNFIPVIRLLDNKAGMWDTVTKQFYTTPVGDFITG